MNKFTLTRLTRDGSPLPLVSEPIAIYEFELGITDSYVYFFVDQTVLARVALDGGPVEVVAATGTIAQPIIGGEHELYFTANECMWVADEKTLKIRAVAKSQPSLNLTDLAATNDYLFSGRWSTKAVHRMRRR